jgi:hypothetical protein
MRPCSRSKHVEQLRSIGIINSTTRSHLVVYFCKIYIMMHGSMNIKFCYLLISEADSRELRCGSAAADLLGL